MSTVADQLGDWASRIQFEDIPASIVRELEWHVLDTVGVLLGASQLEYARHLAASTIDDGGTQEATLIGAGGKVPARGAAFFNACLGHGLDLDDVHLEARLHPTATILPSVLAIAEATGLSGKETLTSLAVGIEAMIRIGLACGKQLADRGLDPTSLCGTFGATLAAAKAFGLDRGQMINALGVAGGMCAGLHEGNKESATNRRIHSGVAAQAGFTAAELASVGYTGPATIFEGTKGFLSAFADSADSASTVTAGLGSDWNCGNLKHRVPGIASDATAQTEFAGFNEDGIGARNDGSPDHRAFVSTMETVGQELPAATDVSTGTLEKPLPQDRVISKFRLLTEPLIGVDAAERLADLILALQSRPAIGSIMELMAPMTRASDVRAQ